MKRHHRNLSVALGRIELVGTELIAVFFADSAHVDAKHDGHGAGDRIVRLPGSGGSVEYLVARMHDGFGGRRYRSETGWKSLEQIERRSILAS